MTNYQPDISFRAIGKLSLPILMANFSIIGSAIIDTAMAGQLGADHLAVVAVGNAAVVMVLLTVANILQSLSPIAGHLYGARLYERIGFEMTQCLWLAIPLSLLCIGILIQTDFLVSFCHLSGNVAHMTSLLLIAAAIGMPSYVFSRPYLTVNAAINRPQVTMWISFITLALKAPLNAIFMYGWLGVPALGGAGAGVAAAINGYVGLVAYIVIWKTSSHYKGMYPAKFYWPEWHSIAQHLKIGLPISLSTFFEVSSFTLMAIFIARLGTFTVAAHQIVANITAAIYQIPLSLGIAASVLVAQCCGARELILARQASIRILKLALTIAALFSVLLFLLRSPLASLYTKDAQVIEIASNLLIFGAVYHVFDAMQTISAFALRGYKVTFLPMMIYGVLLWSLGLGGGYWFCFGAKEFGGPYGAGGFWGAVRVGLVLAGLALMAFLLFVSNERAKDKHHVWFRSERFKALLKKAPKNRF